MAVVGPLKLYECYPTNKLPYEYVSELGASQQIVVTPQCMKSATRDHFWSFLVIRRMCRARVVCSLSRQPSHRPKTNERSSCLALHSII